MLGTQPTGRRKRRPMTGSAKQSIPQRGERMDCLVAITAKKKQTDKLLILFNVMDEPPPSVLFHPRGSAKGRCGTRNDGKSDSTTRPGLSRWTSAAVRNGPMWSGEVIYLRTRHTEILYVGSRSSGSRKSGVSPRPSRAANPSGARLTRSCSGAAEQVTT